MAVKIYDEIIDAEHWQWHRGEYVQKGLDALQPNTYEEKKALVDALMHVYEVRHATLADRILN
jgi:hypothetical protein